MKRKHHLQQNYAGRSAVILFIGFALGTLYSCQKTNPLSEGSEAALNTDVEMHEVASLSSPISLLTDQTFQQGLSVLHPTGGAIQDTLQYPGAASSPQWKLAQWYSSSSLYGASATALPSGSYRFADSNKAITLGPSPSADRDLIFAINGQNDFGNVYRTSSQPFPHLLVDQKIADPDGWLGTATPFIGSMNSLDFNVDAYLEYHTRNQKSGYNSSIHALQFSCVFLVQNLRSGNAGYGKSMYFSIMLFDDRYSLPGLAINSDIFSGQLIYDVGLAAFSSSGLVQGQWKTVQGNLLPKIKQALDEAWNRGFLLESQSYNDYKVSLFTMGFECSGLNIGTMKIRNLSLVAD
ncbi:hypothetical protein [Sphingobacterium pedocola]|uniref:DUF4465 domain-containing protein n=1 Tax=Sphingobacterium pedocola TaxID=2082722 RepID=A0ABR9TBE1_9SPHI|nr:hypothetical protein [Sphingobacterium pedocola]MBE8721972.1 hypothetical protein [Sphingobacterium pedocola]